MLTNVITEKVIPELFIKIIGISKFMWDRRITLNAYFDKGLSYGNLASHLHREQYPERWIYSSLRLEYICIPRSRIMNVVKLGVVLSSN